MDNSCHSIVKMAEGTKTYTLAEVAQHKVTKGADKSVWVVIHDKVYDVTPFLDEVNKGSPKRILSRILS